MEKYRPGQRTGWRKFLRWQWLAGLAAFMILGAWGLAELNRPAPPPPKPPQPAEAQSRMEALSLTEIQDGDKRWVLEAQKADFLNDKMAVSISGVKVEFFGPGEHLKVKADQGLFHTKTRVLTLKGQVEIERGELHVSTSQATYEPASGFWWPRKTWSSPSRCSGSRARACGWNWRKKSWSWLNTA